MWEFSIALESLQNFVLVMTIVWAILIVLNKFRYFLIIVLLASYFFLLKADYSLSEVHNSCLLDKKEIIEEQYTTRIWSDNALNKSKTYLENFEEQIEREICWLPQSTLEVPFVWKFHLKATTLNSERAKIAHKLFFKEKVEEETEVTEVE